MRTALFCVITQRVVLIFYRRFGTTFRSHLPLRFLTLKLGPIGCPETSVRNYHDMQRNNPGQRSFHWLHFVYLRQYTVQVVVEK